jgi:predicted transporter
LSYEDFLYRKAEQNAHSEILAFLMMILGMNLLIGGLIVTIMAVGQLNLFPFMLQQPLSQSATLGLILTLSGFSILLAGFILVINYDRQRSWHLSQIEKSTKLKSRKITITTADEILERLTEEKKRS